MDEQIGVSDSTASRAPWVPARTAEEPHASTVTRRERPPLLQLPFLALVAGQFLANLGNNVYQLALMWAMKELTGSTVMMSTISIATLLPLLVFGPVSGVLVDRWPKRRAMMGSDIFRALVVGTLTACTALHQLAPWMLIATAALVSCAGSLYNPANSALLPLLVEREQLQQANSITQSNVVLTQVLGPLVGALLVAHVSLAAAFLANAVGFLASVASLLFVRAEEPARQFHPLNARRMVHEVKEGLLALAQLPALRQMMPIALIANFLFAPFELILIQYCTEVLHGGVQLYGAFGTAFALGMLMGGAVSGLLAKRIRKGRLATVALPVMALPIIAMAFVRASWLALTLAAVFGVFNMIINVLFITLVQEWVPQDKLGRATGSIGIVVQGSTPFAQALGGVLLRWFSVPALMAAIGVLETLNALYGVSRKEIRGMA
jgi:DHA3 family macrolide efflux protein-like MFS transporter